MLRAIGTGHFHFILSFGANKISYFFYCSFLFAFHVNRSEVSGLYSFLGIRFAEPPIGQFRFRRPQYKRLEGDINATVFGMPCPQPDSAGYIVGSEDCLWLNVYTPRMPDESTGLPVIVWIHGGGYRYGSANQYTVIPFFSKCVHQFLSKVHSKVKNFVYFVSID